MNLQNADEPKMARISLEELYCVRERERERERIARMAKGKLLENKLCVQNISKHFRRTPSLIKISS